ncbi:MAG: replication-relaxation family protein [Bacteriovoracaceae bacterium]|nr:replication-relaxation family protein [Bacteriovoracaceae bacterium]
MTEFMNLNSLHLNYLGPLLKWRVMDLESLRRECFRIPKYHNFYRVIRSLEKRKVLEGYRDPFSRKKFVYLSSLGEAQLSIRENSNALSRETLIHDIKVSEIVRALLDSGLIENAELEHQIHDKRTSRNDFEITPDAVLYYEKDGKKIKVALELELTRKNNQRITEKARQYLYNSFYQNVIYIFPQKELMKKYQEVMLNKLGDDVFKRLHFFYHPELTFKPYKFDAIMGEIEKNEMSLKDFLGPGK